MDNLESLKTELSAAIRSSDSVSQGADKSLAVFKKYMTEILAQVADMPDRRNEDYSRFSKNVSGIISDIKKL